MKPTHIFTVKYVLMLGIITALLAPVLSADTITTGKVVGSAKLIDSSGERPAKAGVTIGENARVTTGDRSRVILLFDNGSAVTVRPNSKFSVQQYDHEPARNNKSITRLKVDKGDVISNVDKLGNGSTFEVNSELGTAGIRGTNLRVNVNAGTISVTDGNAQVQLSNGQTVNIPSGNTFRLTVKSDGEVTYQVTEMSEEEQQVMENTSTEADETEDQTDSAQTGAAGESDPAEVASDVTDTTADDSGQNNSESELTILLVRNGTAADEAVELDRDAALSILENPDNSQFADLLGQLNDNQLTRLGSYPDTIQTKLLDTGDIQFIESALNINPLFSNKDLRNLINEPLVQAGKVGNVLLSDVTLSGSLPSNNIFTYSEVFENGYSDALVRLLAAESGNEDLAEAINEFAPNDVSADTPFADFIKDDINEDENDNSGVLGTREFNDVSALSDFDFAPQDGQSVLGKRIVLAAGSTYDLKSYIGSGNIEPNSDGEVFAISAFKDVVIDGDITFENNNTDNDNAVVIGAADELKIASGTGNDKTEITNQGSNLALGADKSISMTNVSLDTKGTLLVGTLKNLTMNDVTVQTGQNSRRGEVYLYADNTMNVNGLNFGNSAPSQIYMEAITVDLRNVVFPSSSDVDLVSRYGPKPGGYPTFKQENREVGRVNFIKNVRVDETLIDSEVDFDQSAPNITIKSFE